MTGSDRMNEAWSRLLDANVRYYEALGKVTSDYVAAITRAILPGPLAIKLPIGNLTSRPPHASPESQPVAKSSGPLLVLEAPAGQTARSAFVINNGLSRETTAPVMVSSLHTEHGAEIRPPIRVVPGALTLAPGEKSVVQLLVAIDESMTVGIDHFGVIRVPELSTEQIPFVVRRLADSAPESLVPAKRAAGRRRPRRNVKR